MMKLKNKKNHIIIWGAIAAIIAATPVYSAGKKGWNSAAKKRSEVYMIDTFSDGTYLEKPKWWRFGSLYLSIEKNKKEDVKFLTRNALRFQGATNKWYVGGCGTYLGIDSMDYNAVKLVVFSRKKDLSMLRIELYDDDNGNHEVDMDLTGTKAVEDDVFIYNVIFSFRKRSEVA